jgi:hypothetical protein
VFYGKWNFSEKRGIQPRKPNYLPQGNRGLPPIAMKPQMPQSTRTLLSIDDQGHRLEVDAEAFVAFRDQIEKSLAELEAKWAAWAPPVSQKADRRNQIRR